MGVQLNPLTWNVPIVNKEGRPSKEFQIKWAQLNRAAGSIVDLSTPAEVSAVLDILSGGAINGSLLVRSGGTWQGYPSPSNGAKFLSGNNPPTWQDVDDADLVLSDVLTNDVNTSKHGFAPKAPNDATKFLDGVGAWDTVKDSDLSLSDITTNDVSTTKHGFAPKAPNDATKYLDGTGAWSVPAGSGGGGGSGSGGGDNYLYPDHLRPTVAGATVAASTLVGMPFFNTKARTVDGVRAYITSAGSSRNIYGTLYSSVGLTMAGGSKLAQSTPQVAVTGLNTMAFTVPVTLAANTWYWMGFDNYGGSGNVQLMLSDVTQNSYEYFTEATGTAPATAPAVTAGTGGTAFSWWLYEAAAASAAVLPPFFFPPLIDQGRDALFGGNSFVAVPFITETAITMTGIKVFARSGANQFASAIYSRTFNNGLGGGTLMSQGTLVAQSNGAINTLPFSAPQSLVAGTLYWVGLWVKGGGNSQLGYSPSRAVEFFAASAASLPTPASASTTADATNSGWWAY